jgi:hypothetical protein
MQTTMQDASRQMIRRQNLTSLVPAARLYPLRENPLVTVITPTYNRAAFLEETIESVLTQDYLHVEYLVLDDGSTDDSAKVLEKYQGRDGMLVLFHENIGETLTVNKGFSLATGDIVVVVNSDDPLLPGAIREAVRYMRVHPEVLAAYPDWIEIDARSQELARMYLPHYDIGTMLMGFNNALGPGTFIRREAFDLIGFRNPDLKYTGDLDFWFRLARVSPLGHISEFLATHRRHDDCATFSGRGAVMAGELIRLVREAYASGALPEELRRRRFRAYGLAHYAAARQSGRDVREWTKHVVLAVCYGAAHILRRIGAVLGGSA